MQGSDGEGTLEWILFLVELQDAPLSFAWTSPFSITPAGHKDIW